MPPNLLIELLNNLQRVKTWQQAAVLIVTVLIIFSSHPQEPFQGVPDYESRSKISSAVPYTNAVAIVVHRLDSQSLTPTYSSNPAIEGKSVDGFGHDDLIDQLQLGNCGRSGDFAVDKHGVPLGAIVCPIYREEGLVGAISAVYYQMPLKNSDGTDDPISWKLFTIGLSVD